LHQFDHESRKLCIVINDEDPQAAAVTRLYRYLSSAGKTFYLPALESTVSAGGGLTLEPAVANPVSDRRRGNHQHLGNLVGGEIASMRLFTRPSHGLYQL
jgi:hypothetical protein